MWYGAGLAGEGEPGWRPELARGLAARAEKDWPLGQPGHRSAPFLLTLLNFGVFWGDGSFGTPAVALRAWFFALILGSLECGWLGGGQLPGFPSFLFLLWIPYVNRDAICFKKIR